jgi:hypothetical protein
MTGVLLHSVLSFLKPQFYSFESFMASLSFLPGSRKFIFIVYRRFLAILCCQHITACVIFLHY